MVKVCKRFNYYEERGKWTKTCPLQTMDIALAARSDTATLFFCGQHVTLVGHPHGNLSVNSEFINLKIEQHSNLFAACSGTTAQQAACRRAPGDLLQVSDISYILSAKDSRVPESLSSRGNGGTVGA
jgi:hypothetical protein